MVSVLIKFAVSLLFSNSFLLTICNDDPHIFIPNSNSSILVLTPGESLDLQCILPLSSGSISISSASMTDSNPILSSLLHWKIVDFHGVVLFSQDSEVKWEKTSSHSRRPFYDITTNVNNNSIRFFIKEVMFEDAGLYQCHGRAKMQMVTVQVVSVSGSEVVVATEFDVVPVWKEQYHFSKFSQNEVAINCTCRMSQKVLSMATITWSGALPSYVEYATENRNDQLGLIESVLTFPLDISRPEIFTNHICLCGFGGKNGRSAQGNVTVQPIFISRSSPIKVNSGEESILKCEAFANPPLTPFLWLKSTNGKRYQELVDLTDLTSSLENHKRIETLRLMPVKDEDRGIYVCRVNNSLGVSEYRQGLRVRGQWAAIWPFLGIVAEICIMTTLIIIYEKKRRHQQQRVSTLSDNSEVMTNTRAQYHSLPTQELHAAVNPALIPSPLHSPASTSHAAPYYSLAISQQNRPQYSGQNPPSQSSNPNSFNQVESSNMKRQAPLPPNNVQCSTDSFSRNNMESVRQRPVGT